MDLTGRKALVTGAGRRLGRAFAEGLLSRGASVAIHFHDSRGGAEEAASRSPERSAALQADLSRPEEADRLVPRAAEALGGLDILVNNAGIFEPAGIQDTELDAWTRHLAVNLTAPFLLCRSFARVRSGPGAVVNILDWRATRPTAREFAYSVSKAGLAAMTRSLAAALAPDVRVNGLALGAILPPAGGVEPGILDRVPLGRTGTVDECVEALLFLIAGPAYVTGEILYLDGGRHLT